jgi:hypothetical protein
MTRCEASNGKVCEGLLALGTSNSMFVPRFATVGATLSLLRLRYAPGQTWAKGASFYRNRSKGPNIASQPLFLLRKPGRRGNEHKACEVRARKVRSARNFGAFAHYGRKPGHNIGAKNERPRRFAKQRSYICASTPGQTWANLGPWAQT